MRGLNIGDKVTVIYSKELEKAGQTVLVSRSGHVTDIVEDCGVIKGAYIDIMVMRRIRNYFVPINSIDGSEDINKIRTLDILKSTIL